MSQLPLTPSDEMRLFLAVVGERDAFISLPWTHENYLVALKKLNEVPSQMCVTINGAVVAMIYDSLTPGKILVETVPTIIKMHELAFDELHVVVTSC